MSSEGRLEVCINNAWGTVCNNQFTKEEARVACLQLSLLHNLGEPVHHSVVGYHAVRHLVRM